MKRAWMAMLAAMAAVLLGGCGTICTFGGGDPDIYGGVQKDVAFIQTPRWNIGGGGSGSGQAGILLAGLVMADAAARSAELSAKK
jgi:uncharacterized protein YceK